MSYLIPPRPYDDDHNQNGRIHVPSSYDGYPSQSTSQQPSPFSSDRPPVQLPKLGQTRCYWALLSADLDFIYLDPVLASHLEQQSELLVGKSLMSFMHPDEHASAKQDLGNVLESRTLHGSVTRVRFSRLSAVRRQLGYDGPPAPFPDADKIAVDANYMAVDIVINWAAEGLVLCFIHAVVDLTPNDNDEQNKTCWTNWCGTPLMDADQIQLLYGRLLVCLPQRRPGSLSRVFQILANEPDRRLLMSWPPDTNLPPSGRDFARLVENAHIGTPDVGGAKTSCTRRYKALQNTPSVIGGEVESIFIPHGTVIFACHKVDPPSRSTASPRATMQQLGYSGTNYNPHPPQSPSFYESSSYALPPLNSTAPSYNTGYPSQATGYAPQRWSQGGEPQSSYNGWGTPSPAHSTSPLPPAVSNLRSGSYPAQQSHQWQPPSPSYMDAPSGAPTFNRSMSPSYSYSPAGGSEGGSPSSDVVPPARRRVSPGSTREQFGSGGRSSGNRPMGVLKCSSCKATTSPEWRKGPSGKKELCNACGLRYARSRAKKDGNQAQRRKKDKGGVTKRESATPPTSASPSYSAMRRSYGDTFSSAGSTSGSEIYTQTGHHMLNEITPSPSPPAPNVNFVHYSPGDNRQSYSNTSGSFYNSSPLSNPPVLHPHDQPQQQGNQLPPLDRISTYADRSLHPTGSPISHSPLSTAAPASYERDRDRGRPAPVSVGPRHLSSRRSILTHQ